MSTGSSSAANNGSERTSPDSINSGYDTVATTAAVAAARQFQSSTVRANRSTHHAVSASSAALTKRKSATFAGNTGAIRQSSARSSGYPGG